MSGASWQTDEVIQDGGLMEGQDFALKKLIFMLVMEAPV